MLSLGIRRERGVRRGGYIGGGVGGDGGHRFVVCMCCASASPPFGLMLLANMAFTLGFPCSYALLAQSPLRMGFSFRNPPSN